MYDCLPRNKIFQCGIPSVTFLRKNKEEKIKIEKRFCFEKLCHFKNCPISKHFSIDVIVAVFEEPMNDFPDNGHGGFSDDDGGDGMDEVRLKLAVLCFQYNLNTLTLCVYTYMYFNFKNALQGPGTNMTMSVTLDFADGQEAQIVLPGQLRYCTVLIEQKGE